MTTRTTLTGLLAGTALFATSLIATAQTTADDDAAHHPDIDATAPDGASAGADANPMPGMMGMMTPEMMQMMMRMMGEGGMSAMRGGMRDSPMADGMPDLGMMGRGLPGMDGLPMGPMTMHGPQRQMGGHALGPGALYGMPHGATTEMTPARVEAFLSHMLERHNNPRLEIGEITEAEDGSIIAEIVTVDGSLVQRLSFNRYPGLFRQID